MNTFTLERQQRLRSRMAATGWLLTSAMLVFPSACFAQGANAASPDDFDIVVTAQKREQRLQDVPLAVSAVTGEQIEQLGARSFKDIILSTPGVSYSGSDDGLSVYNIRGVSSNAESPAVGVYVNDISILTVSTFFAGAADPAFFDFERVEVLRGPQGTLYGGSAMGGAIKYVTRRPRLDQTQFLGAASTSVTEGGEPTYEFEAVANFPIIEDVLALRVGALYRERGGFIDAVPHATIVNRGITTTQTPPYTPLSRDSLGTISGNDRNSSQTTGARLGAVFEPDAEWSVEATLMWNRYALDATNSFVTDLPQFQSSPRTESPMDDDLRVGEITIERNFQGVDFTSLTGYVDRTLNLDLDYSFFIGGLVPALYPLTSFNDSVTDSTTLTQEFRLASDDAESRWQWVAGLFYSNQDDELLQVITTTGIGAVLGGPDESFRGVTKTSTEQYAAFGEVTYDLLDNVHATVGFRLFGLRQDLSLVGDGVLNGGHTEVSGRRNEEFGFNPRYSLSVDLSDDNLLYVTAAKGFRPGGPNRFDINETLCRTDLDRLGLQEAPNTYASDNLWNYEIGSKNEFAGGRVVVNAAAFYTDWQGIQQNTNLTGCGFTFTTNVGAAEIRGGEISAQAELGEGLRVGGSTTYTDSHITESAPGVAAQVGQEVLNVPRWMANAFLDYSFDLAAEWQARWRLDYQYHGSSFRSFSPTRSTRLPDGARVQIPDPTHEAESYEVVNLNVSVEHQDWEIGLFANNLLDADPYLNFGQGAGISTATTLWPRTVGLRLRKLY